MELFLFLSSVPHNLGIVLALQGEGGNVVTAIQNVLKLLRRHLLAHVCTHTNPSLLEHLLQASACSTNETARSLAVYLPCTIYP